MWAILFVISTLYTYWWELVHDWDLPARCQPEGRRMIWTDRWPYVLVAFGNLAMRFGWMLSVMPGATPFNQVVTAHIIPYLGFVEVLRRTLWSLIRLEKEHLTKGLDYDKAVLNELQKRAASSESSAPRSYALHQRVILRMQVVSFVVVVLAVIILAYLV